MTVLRMRPNNQGGLLGGSGLTSSGTTITFAIAPNFPNIFLAPYVPIALDVGKSNYEIVWLIGYTAGSTTGTIVRAAEDATNWPASAHATGATWFAVATQMEYMDVDILANRPTAAATNKMYFSTDDAGGTMAVDSASGTWTNTSKRGLLGSASVSSNSSNFTTGGGAITGLSVTVVAGVRPLKVSLTGQVTTSGFTSAYACTVALQESVSGGAASSIQTKGAVSPFSSQPVPVDQFAIRTPTAGATIVYTVYAVAGSSGTELLVASATSPALLLVEEV